MYLELSSLDLTSTTSPKWYLALALVVSLYQAYRGFMFQWVFGVDTKGGVFRQVMLLCIADMFTYFVCAASGFFAFFAAFHLLTPDYTSSWLLLLYGILGVTGKLPDLLHRLRFDR